MCGEGAPSHTSSDGRYDGSIAQGGGRGFMVSKFRAVQVQGLLLLEDSEGRAPGNAGWKVLFWGGGR